MKNCLTCLLKGDMTCGAHSSFFSQDPEWIYLVLIRLELTWMVNVRDTAFHLDDSSVSYSIHWSQSESLQDHQFTDLIHQGALH